MRISRTQKYPDSWHASKKKGATHLDHIHIEIAKER
jgi:hypothetical protein